MNRGWLLVAKRCYRIKNRLLKPSLEKDITSSLYQDEDPRIL
ncbi:hypothetical protein JCM19235_1629 [Vibrio maritimus]|uniref:Uncharacterized protein n=1 Tax=Vibrio maritimus TaxID=990268 RepID=A0A090SR04_9VIBR|nr:hypothetical protein JCM19235_1629 [Vibrio maritimus]